MRPAVVVTRALGVVAREGLIARRVPEELAATLALSAELEVAAARASRAERAGLASALQRAVLAALHQEQRAPMAPAASPAAAAVAEVLTARFAEV
jgi:hypothetical protein